MPIIILIIHVTYVSAYSGEIIRITNNNQKDWRPIVTPQGHVFWTQKAALGSTDGDHLMYYDGTNTVQVTTEGDFDYLSPGGSASEGNTIVYLKTVPLPSGTSWDIFLFNGQQEMRITDNNYWDNTPIICNGYIVWEAYPDVPAGLQPWDESYAEIYIYKPEPTLVEMSSIKATPSDSKVTLQWKTESEVDNAGFNLWRAEDFQKINQSLIPAKGSPTEGASYEYTDTNVNNKQPYLYKLEDIDLSGKSTMHYPVSAMPRGIYR
jgi:hypothetical protein